MKDNKDQMDLLWTEYKLTGSVQKRNELIESYSSLVKAAAYRIAPSYYNHVELDDIISYGTIGLIDAIEKFNPDKGVKFETYAQFRIKGSIIDQIRQQDWIPRSTREKHKKIESAGKDLEGQLLRQPTEAELAEYLDVPVVELQKTIAEQHMQSIISLDEHIIDLSNDPHDRYEILEIKTVLVSAIEELNENERSVISLYYFDELTLKEIGLVLGISESRVSQLHTRSLKKLKSKLMEQKDLLVAR